MSTDPKIKWMYEGTKADVHREDFLTVKQITKDFELYSDVVRADPEAAREAAIEKSFIKNVTQPSNKNNKVSALGLDVVMHEDPLVAIKVGWLYISCFVVSHLEQFQTKQELRKREIYENPAIQMKLRRALKEEYEKDKSKKQKKKEKKEKKKHKRKHSDSESSEPESPKGMSCF